MIIEGGCHLEVTSKPWSYPNLLKPCLSGFGDREIGSSCTAGEQHPGGRGPDRRGTLWSTKDTGPHHQCPEHVAEATGAV